MTRRQLMFIGVASTLSRVLTSRKIRAASTGFTYYVDFQTGSDLNSGGFGQPWQTLAKVNATALSPGQSVGVNSGCVWRETRLAQSGVSYGSYGTGTPPIISGADLVSSPWAELGNNVYSANLPAVPSQVLIDHLVLARQPGAGSSVGPRR